MKVFKFGGASVVDAQGVRNVANIIKQNSQESICIVVSAMGKTTNALEEIFKAYFYKTGEAPNLLETLKQKHHALVRELFPNERNQVEDELEDIFAELYWAIEETQIKSYDYEYDQIVSQGEFISTRIVAAFLNASQIETHWLDARDLIRTDNTYREGHVDWVFTQKSIDDLIRKKLTPQTPQFFLTQGFIGGTSENYTTTLGREGSDYTAAILAYCLNAKDVTIWKDVPGVLNADPRDFPQAQLLSALSYYDAIELAYYGATVIHPKTIKPLQNKNIPLFVKSFVNPDAPGTCIKEDELRQEIPTYIFKKQQILISVSPRDFSFILEENLRDLFELFSQNRAHVNLMQNSALSFSVCVTIDQTRLLSLIQELDKKYKVKYNEHCELITIRNYSDELANQLIGNRPVLLEQKSRQTLQVVLKEIQNI
jgi:aspartate kinase